MRLSVILFGTVILVVIAVFFGARRPRRTHVEGGIYSITAENGGYAVVKILKMDEGGVHLRMYSNVFPERPADVDTSKLYMAGIDHKASEQLGMGHAPVSHSSFQTWNAEFIKREIVRGEELEGYKMWKDANGGYF
jgi:hypothetical protein